MRKCANCRHGHLEPGETTITLERGDAVVVIKRVPALVCDECGESFLEESISRTVGELAEQSLKNGHKIQLLDFAA